MSYLDERRNQKMFGKPPKEKKKYVIPKKSAKKIAEEKAEKDLRGGEDTELLRWYKNRQKQLTGKCMRCGATYDHKNLTYAISATAHILPKRESMFPSVALHKDNFIELNSFCGCHNWYDNYASWEDIAQDKIWPLVLERFRIFEPYIKERTKIPEVLAQEIKPKI